MIVHGSGLHTSTQVKTGCKPLKGGHQKKAEHLKNDIVEISDCGQERSELLQKIRKRIKSGYYNSETVIDDISHGFAKALDAM